MEVTNKHASLKIPGAPGENVSLTVAEDQVVLSTKNPDGEADTRYLNIHGDTWESGRLNQDIYYKYDPGRNQLALSYAGSGQVVTLRVPSLITFSPADQMTVSYVAKECLKAAAAKTPTREFGAGAVVTKAANKDHFTGVVEVNPPWRGEWKIRGLVGDPSGTPGVAEKIALAAKSREFGVSVTFAGGGIGVEGFDLKKLEAFHDSLLGDVRKSQQGTTGGARAARTHNIPSTEGQLNKYYNDNFNRFAVMSLQDFKQRWTAEDTSHFSEYTKKYAQAVMDGQPAGAKYKDLLFIVLPNGFLPLLQKLAVIKEVDPKKQEDLVHQTFSRFAKEVLDYDVTKTHPDFPKRFV